MVENSLKISLVGRESANKSLVSDKSQSIIDVSSQVKEKTEFEDIINYLKKQYD